MSNPSPASAIIAEFVLDRLHTLTVAERIKVSRAAAILLPEGKEQRALARIADGLERLERQQRQLTLRFKQRRR